MTPSYEQLPVDYPIKFIQGDDLRIPLQLVETNAQGAEVPINLDAYTIEAVLYKKGDPILVFNQVKAAQSTDTGWIEFTLDRSTTSLLGERFYSWSVRWVDPNNMSRYLIWADATVTPNG